MGSAASTFLPSTTSLRLSQTSDSSISFVNFCKVALSLVGTRILFSDLEDLNEETTTMAEFDTLELRNRDVTETLSKVDDLGQDKPATNGDSAEFDKLELRNRTVTETLSPVDDLGQDKKETNGTDKTETNGTSNGDAKEGDEEYDTLQLRNRVVTETLSPVDDLGQDKKEQEVPESSDEPSKKKMKHETLTSIPAEVHDTLELRNRDVEETLTNIDIDVA